MNNLIKTQLRLVITPRAWASLRTQQRDDILDTFLCTVMTFFETTGVMEIVPKRFEKLPLSESFACEVFALLRVWDYYIYHEPTMLTTSDLRTALCETLKGKIDLTQISVDVIASDDADKVDKLC